MGRYDNYKTRVACCLRRYRTGLWLLALCVAIKIFSGYPALVERYYTYGMYPPLSLLQRRITAAIPASIGDVLYIAAAILAPAGILLFIRRMAISEGRKAVAAKACKRLAYGLMVVYIWFNISWGLNYDRQGIAAQLKLQTQKPTAASLDSLVNRLLAELNTEAAQVQPAGRARLMNNGYLFGAAIAAYKNAAQRFPFLYYRHPTIKRSLYSEAMNYMGTQGYYNPFTGEAQVNTTVPVSSRPFVTLHEMAHQAGYAKESEANFAGWLVSRCSSDIAMKYSATLSMYRYARYDLWYADSNRVKHYDSLLNPLSKKDIKQERDFYMAYEGKIAAASGWVYNRYLKANKQPAGSRSYNEVVLWLIAYWKKD